MLIPPIVPKPPRWTGLNEAVAAILDKEVELDADEFEAR